MAAEYAPLYTEESHRSSARVLFKPSHRLPSAPPASRLTIAVSVGDAVTLSGLEGMFGSEDDLNVIQSGHDFEASLSFVKQFHPNVFLTESCFDGNCILERLRQASVSTPVVVFTAHASANAVRHALTCGIQGYLTRDADSAKLCEAVRQVAKGSTYIDPRLSAELARQRCTNDLTSRESDVLRLFATGHTTSEIAKRLYVSNRTVEACRSSLKRKLGLSTRAQLHAYAQNKGYLTRCSCA